jgi:hypothetical protein
MSHDSHGPKENKTIISFKNSFWLVVIIVGLFIAALNFIQAESKGEGEGKEKTEVKGHSEAAGEQSEKAGYKAEEPKAAEAPAKDTAAKGGK